MFEEKSVIFLKIASKQSLNLIKNKFPSSNREEHHQEGKEPGDE